MMHFNPRTVTSLTVIHRLAVKCGVVGGAAYLSIQQGVWSSSNQESAEVLKGFRENVIPVTDEYIKQVIMESPLLHLSTLQMNILAC